VFRCCHCCVVVVVLGVKNILDARFGGLSTATSGASLRALGRRGVVDGVVVWWRLLIGNTFRRACFRRRWCLLIRERFVLVVTIVDNGL
jgi:hypothetical protein